MANLNYNYKTHYLPDLDITFKFFFLGEEENQLGTIEEWRKPVDQMRARMQFSQFWAGGTIEVWHMDHPDLPYKSANGEVHLLDFQLDVEGYQTAVGLCWDSEKIAIGVFPDGWQKQNLTDYLPVKQSNIEYSKLALSHEVGHWYCNESHVLKPNSVVGRFLYDEYSKHRTHQTDNISENFAEDYRAYFGADKAYGKFSDDKPIMGNPKLFTLISVAFMLKGHIDNQRWVRNLTLHDTYVTWEQWEWFKGYTKYAITSNWDKFIETDRGWRIL